MFRLFGQFITAGIILAGLGLAILAGYGAARATAAPEPEPAAAMRPLPSIVVVPAAEGEVVERVRVTGTLVPREEVMVGVDLDGLKLVEILVDVGDHVAAGDVLARLQTDMIEVQLAQNASSLARAEAAIAQVRSQIAEARAANVEAAAALERSRQLADRGVVASDVLEQRQSAADAAAARLEAAERGLDLALADRTLIEAQRREIELRREKTEIRAPADGVILSRSARIGAIASAAGDPLFRIAERGLVELAAEVTETDLARLAAGQPAAVTPAGRSAGIAGAVRLVSPEVAAATRLGSVRVSLADAVGVRVGSFARGDIETARRTGLTIPLSAVFEANGRATVQVVTDGVVETRAVAIGLRDATHAEVTAGLAAGERVIARAGTFVEDGDTVAPVEAAQLDTEG